MTRPTHQHETAASPEGWLGFFYHMWIIVMYFAPLFSALIAIHLFGEGALTWPAIGQFAGVLGTIYGVPVLYRLFTHMDRVRAQRACEACSTGIPACILSNDASVCGPHAAVRYRIWQWEHALGLTYEQQIVELQSPNPVL